MGNVRVGVWDIVVKTDFLPIDIRKFDPVAKDIFLSLKQKVGI